MVQPRRAAARYMSAIGTNARTSWPADGLGEVFHTDKMTPDTAEDSELFGTSVVVIYGCCWVARGASQNTRLAILLPESTPRVVFQQEAPPADAPVQTNGPLWVPFSQNGILIAGPETGGNFGVAFDKGGGNAHIFYDIIQ